MRYFGSPQTRPVWGDSAAGSDVRHVVVLMMENRSFDQMLGSLPHLGGGLEGHRNELHLEGRVHPFPVTLNADPAKVDVWDPPHHFLETTLQVYGTHHPDPGAQPTMSGFAHAAWDWFWEKKKNEGTARILENMKDVFDCFAPGTLPVLHTLARNYAVCTRWFASSPGPTGVNRLFLHAGTSGGEADHNYARCYRMRTIFENLRRDRATYRIYYHDVPITFQLSRMWPLGRYRHFRPFWQFYRDAAAGELPNYTFLEPRYSWELGRGNDQHPDNGVLPGEELIKNVYLALRRSPSWKETMFVLIWDEHGGFFDRAHPPDNVPNPDGLVHEETGFDFTRLGCRVPALVITPFVEPGYVHPTQLEHASVPATLKELFELRSHLTDRDRHANTLMDLISGAGTDAPVDHDDDRDQDPDLAALHAEQLSLSDWDTPRRSRRDAGRIPQPDEHALREPTDLQVDIARMLYQRLGTPADKVDAWLDGKNQHAFSQFFREQMVRHFGPDRGHDKPWDELVGRILVPPDL